MNSTQFCLFLGICFFQTAVVNAQCTTRVTHITGTQLVGCTNITVTSAGGVSNSTVCLVYPIFPYWVGYLGTGSYIFTFDPPISGVTIDVGAINNNGLPLLLEELVMEIDGVPTAFTNAGVGSGCTQPTVVVGGAIRACDGCVSSGRDIQVTQPISTLKLTDTWLSGSPNGLLFSLFICCGSCATDAGLLSGGPLNLCNEQTAILPPATQTLLDPDDLLQYVLHSDPNNPLSSALATSSTPTFTFNPATMTFDTPYYITSIAGNNLNGNVDPADPCLDVSNSAMVTWRPWPTVQYTISDPDICSGDCTTIDLQFTGNAPFELQYALPWDTFSFESLTNNSSLTVCSPAGTPVGPVNLQFVSLSDNYCVCN